MSHIDEAASQALEGVYRCLLSTKAEGSEPLALLDLCSSWTSHYPMELEAAQGARIAVEGLNALELEANSLATERRVANLNKDPSLPYKEGSFDFVTMALSVDYLVDPKAVLAQAHRVLRPGGCLVIAFSNRCFDSKAVSVWLEHIDEGAALASLVCDFVHFAAPDGWLAIQSLDVTPDGHGDPMWVVTAVKKF